MSGSDMQGAVAKQHRLAEFREIARSVVFNDRDRRKYGLTVDTAGAIARALEKAYQRGRKEEREGEPPYLEHTPNGPIEWKLILPRPRDAFWSICVGLLGKPDGRVVPSGGLELMQDVCANVFRWTLIRKWSAPDEFDELHSWGQRTIKPLIDLGLLCSVGEDRLEISELGNKSWKYAVANNAGLYPW